MDVNYNFFVRSILFSFFLFFSGCNSYKYNKESTYMGKDLYIKSKCFNETVFIEDIPGYISYFEYQGMKIKFEPDSNSYSESKIVYCLKTNKGLIIVGENKTYPSESISQMNISTYYYNGELKEIKYLNKEWSCIPDYSNLDYLHLKNLYMNIKCKGKKDKIYDSDFEKKFKVRII